MKEINLNKNDIKNIISSKNIVNRNEKNAFELDGELIKFSPIFLEDFYNTKYAIRSNYEIDYDQIEWLSSLNGEVDSTLPSGIVTYQNTNVGVIYPEVFYDYENFNMLSRENEILFLNNLKEGIKKHINLMEHGIYNRDFVSENILYNDKDVQLINLDGKYINNEPCNTYEYFIDDLKQLLAHKIRKSYCVVDYIKIMDEIKEIINNESRDNIDYPLQIVRKIEKMNIVK